MNATCTFLNVGEKKQRKRKKKNEFGCIRVIRRRSEAEEEKMSSV